MALLELAHPTHKSQSMLEIRRHKPDTGYGRVKLLAVSLA
jgi:hypothetical protein